MTSIIYFSQFLTRARACVFTCVLKDNHLCLRHSRTLGDSFGIGVGGCDLTYRSWYSVRKNLFTQISTSLKGNIPYTWPRSLAGPLDAFSFAFALPRTIWRIFLSLTYHRSRLRCRDRKQFVRLGQRASSAEVLHVEGLRTPQASYRSRDSAFAIIKRDINFPNGSSVVYIHSIVIYICSKKWQVAARKFHSQKSHHRSRHSKDISEIGPPH